MKEEETYKLEIEGARFYEEKFVPTLFEKWAGVMVDRLEIQKSDHFLDVACGTGIVARTAGSRIDNLRVSGCDINNAMLEVAKEIAPPITWIKAGAEDLPFQEQSFDKIGCQFGIMFFEDKIESLNEMLRVRKDKGRIIIGIWDVIEANTGYYDLQQLLEKIGGNELGQILMSPFSLGNKEEIISIIQSSNASKYEIETIKKEIEFPSIEYWIDCDVKASPVAEKITEAQYSELLKEAKTKLNKYIFGDEKVRFEMSGHLLTIE
jgi:ubiquinone/menaquinone biosynthesis C-methylase UbiE